MSIFFKARSGRFSASMGIFLIRLSLGSLFLFAGAKKVIDLQQFIRSVQETGQMNDTVAFILAFILPFMELIFGALFLIGLFTPISSFFLACMTVSFILVLGPGHAELPFSYNFVFLACFVGVMFTGAGYISFDALMDRKKDPTKPDTVYREPVKTTDQKLDEAEVIFVEESDVKG